MNPQYIVIHHSLTKDGIIADWEAIRKHHKNVNGWSDIGYHYGIERVGKNLLLVDGRTLAITDSYDNLPIFTG